MASMSEVTITAPLRSRFGVSLPILFGLLVYANVMALPQQTLGDPDTYWHIVLGNWIVDHLAVPRHDLFSFTMPGAPFVPFEWLAEVAIAAIYDHLGWAGLAAATALSAAGTLALLLRFLLRSLAPIHALLPTALAWHMISGHILARPHIFALPILVLWAAALVKARDEDRSPSLWLVPLMVLWANLHGSFIFGLALAAMFAVEALIAAPDWRARRRAARGWVLFGALVLLAALATPFGVEGLLQPFRLLGMSFALAALMEWGSPDFQHYQPLEIWLMVVLAAAFSLRWRLPATRLLMLLLLLHMALQHRRHIEILGLIAPLLLAPALAHQLEDRPGSSRFLRAVDYAIAELKKPATALGISLSLALLIALTALVLPRRGLAVAANITPAAAVDAVVANHVEGPVLNDYGFGGYLIFRGFKVFIDGRADFYGDAFIKRYAEAIALQSDEFFKLVDQYGIAWTLLPPDRPAVRMLDRLPGWRRLYGDDIAVVHVRDTQSRP
jgi:hypothetical protein